MVLMVEVLPDLIDVDEGYGRVAEVFRANFTSAFDAVATLD